MTPDEITEAITKLPCETNMVRMYCPAMRDHPTMTFRTGDITTAGTLSCGRLGMLTRISRIAVSATNDTIWSGRRTCSGHSHQGPG